MIPEGLNVLDTNILLAPGVKASWNALKPIHWDCRAELLESSGNFKDLPENARNPYALPRGELVGVFVSQLRRPGREQTGEVFRKCFFGHRYF